MGSGVASSNVGLLGGGLKNRLLNGDMSVDQVNEGAAVSVPGVGDYYSVDKWVGNGAAGPGIFSLQRLAATPPPQFINYLRALVTTADAAPAAGYNYSFYQKVEGTYFTDLNFGQSNALPVSVSFWFRSSLTGTFGGSLRNGAANRSFPFSFAYPLANTWLRISVAVPGDKIGTWPINNTTSIILTIDVGCGSTFRGNAGSWVASNLIGVTGTTRLISTLNATMDLTGAQLEYGAIATSFEHIPDALMLLLLQREYCKSFAIGVAPAQGAGQFTGELIENVTVAGAVTQRLNSGRFPIKMRQSNPTVTLYNPNQVNDQIRYLPGGDCSASAVVFANADGFRLQCTGFAGSVVGEMMGVHWTANARL